MDLIQVRKVEYRPLVHLVVVGGDDHIQVGNLGDGHGAHVCTGGGGVIGVTGNDSEVGTVAV